MKRPELTPGPWHAEECASHIAVSRQGWPRDAWQIASFGHQKHDAANAQAIAALPDLLAALEDIFPILMASDQSATDKGMENSKRIAALRGVMIRAGYTF